jgi:hypothetical protein
MRFTYIRSDKNVGIDGEFIKIDNIQFDPEVDAIQWYDTHGEIEFVNRQQRNNEIFEDIDYIQSLIDFWNDEKIKQDQLIAEKEQQQQNQQNNASVEADNQKLLNMINSGIST